LSWTTRGCPAPDCPFADAEVVVDAGRHGRAVRARDLRDLGADVVELFTDLDGTFPPPRGPHGPKK